MALEEKYEILITNYLELEKEFINISVSEMVRDTNGYRGFFEILLALNVRMANLLSSVRLYIHTLNRHLSKCLPDIADIKAQVEALLNKEYDKYFEYRFMEAFRNHIQHVGTSVHYASVGSHWTDANRDKGFLEYSLYYSAKKEKLLSDGSFKKIVLDEMPDEVNLCFATRKYIESISFIHEQARGMIDTCIADARRTFEDAISEYKLKYEGNIIGLTASEYDEENIIDEVSVSLDWDDVRTHLVNKNQRLVNLSKRCATNQARNK